MMNMGWTNYTFIFRKKQIDISHSNINAISMQCNALWVMQQPENYSCILSLDVKYHLTNFRMNFSVSYHFGSIQNPARL